MFRGSISNPAPARDTPTYGRGTLVYPKPKNLDYGRFRVSDTESGQPSVKLKVDLKQYISKLKQLEELVEEINRMEISIEMTKE